jgi:SAM-dependent methyltransferase
MIQSRFVRLPVFILSLFMIAAGVFAQTPAGKGEPKLGQEGKDAKWVPTSSVLAERMLDLAKVTSRDYVIDLGSGDGRTVIAAGKRGARALGIEYNPDLVALSKRNAVSQGVADKAQFIQGDLFESDFSQATVITLFLGEEINLRLRPRILDLKPGTRVVSNHFTMGNWAADETVTVGKGDECDYYCTAYLWIVPARVEGTWRFPQGELRLEQSFQRISGIFKSSGRTFPVMNGKLSGDLIHFRVGNAHYSGRVSGHIMQGTFESGGSPTEWSATRVDKVLQAPSKTPIL